MRSVQIVYDNNYEPFGELIDEEDEKLSSGEWSAYSILILDICPTCKNIIELDSLWGCVTDSKDDSVGVYNEDQLPFIKNEYLRDTAKDMLTDGTELDPSEHL